MTTEKYNATLDKAGAVKTEAWPNTIFVAKEKNTNWGRYMFKLKK